MREGGWRSAELERGETQDREDDGKNPKADDHRGLPSTREARSDGAAGDIANTRLPVSLKLGHLDDHRDGFHDEHAPDERQQ